MVSDLVLVIALPFRAPDIKLSSNKFEGLVILVRDHDQRAHFPSSQTLQTPCLSFTKAYHSRYLSR